MTTTDATPDPLADRLSTVHGSVVLHLPADGPPIRTDQDAMDTVGDAMYRGAAWVAVPVDRLGDEFFDLRSGIAGAVVQKFVNYRVGMAVVGDVSAYTVSSSSLSAFVTECNRGRQTWFVPDLDAFTERLAAGRGTATSRI